MNNKDAIAWIICETETTSNDQTRVLKEIEVPNGEGGVFKKLVGEGIIQTANEKNRNGRFYADSELFPQLKALRTNELMEAGYLAAEEGHPLSKELLRQQTIVDSNTCARFLSFRTEGNDIWATFCAVNNDLGKKFNMDLAEGLFPAWSLRALGSVVMTARGAEVRNLKVITWDKVIYPSHTRAYTKRVLTESGILVPADKGPGLMEPIYNQSVVNYIKESSANFKCIKESFDIYYDSITLLENGKVQLTDKSNNIIYLNLENYIHNEIMSYASKK